MDVFLLDVLAVDWVCRHGGKMVLGVVAAVVGLIYRWIKSKGDATKTEGLIHGTLALEPNEINEVRARMKHRFWPSIERI